MMQFSESDLLALLPSVRRYALGLTGDLDRAEDLLQDGLERAIKNAHRFQAGTNLKAWLFTIVHNAFLSDRRRDKVRGVQVDHEETTSIQLTTRPDQEATVASNDIQACLDKLRPHEREVLLLVAVEGLSYEEAANVMGVELGTVKSRLFRARERFRDIYERAAAPRVTNEEARAA